MKSKATSATQTLMQVVAIAGMAVILGMIVHKGYADISILAGKHSGADFWRALGEYLIGNLAGGKAPENMKP